MSAKTPFVTAIEATRPAAPWLGGKRNLAKRICAVIDADARSGAHTTYAEPFVGMGGIFLRRTSRPRAEFINDRGREVYTLFRMLHEHYVAFLDLLRFQLTTQANFERLVAVDPETLTDLQRAARFLFLQRTAFGGKVSGRNFGIATDRPARFNLTTLEPDLEALHERLPEGHREDKFAALKGLSLFGEGWTDAETDWTAPLLPPRVGDWASYPALPELFGWSTPGVKTHRTWVIAPDAGSLARRWDALRGARDAATKATMFHPDGTRTVESIVTGQLAGHELRSVAVARDTAAVVTPVRYGFRTFDRQWIIPDHRLISRARPELWAIDTRRQIYLTALDAHSPEAGPALSFCGMIADQHHFKGSFGGRVFPLWRDAAGRVPNVKPALLAHLGSALSMPVTAPDVMAYVAALLAHPGYVARFRKDLLRPGLRVPLTADAPLFAEAVTTGARVIWLHTYGERFADAAQGRPAGPPRLPKGEGPFVPLGGTIPGAPDPLPDDIVYHPETRRLHVGRGWIENVAPEVWAYQVSGRPVLRQWFSYRRRDRTRPVIGERKAPSPLEAIQPDLNRAGFAGGSNS